MISLDLNHYTKTKKIMLTIKKFNEKVKSKLRLNKKNDHNQILVQSKAPVQNNNIAYPPNEFQMKVQLIYLILSDPMMFLRCCIMLIIMSGVVILMMSYCLQMTQNVLNIVEKVVIDGLKWGSLMGTWPTIYKLVLRVIGI